jgi:2-amino-4-hydroxy-6-hydroxymethyldihydropteridine diphosphokinase
VNLWQPVYIGVGSNVDDPAAQVRLAVQKLHEVRKTHIVSVSALYGSRPFGPIAQPNFVNAVAGALTWLEPREFLLELQKLEESLGRPARHPKWGPRVIDLDLLVYGSEHAAEPGLSLPHPGIAERNFVLYPLADIAPALDVPGMGRVSELAARVSGQDIWPL